MKFVPDYQNIVDCALNKKPKRIPLYEHNISPLIMEKIIGKSFASNYEMDKGAFFKDYCVFFKSMGYDTVTYEGCITEVLPFGGALSHPRPGYIDSREKFDLYPFDKIKDLYIERFDADYTMLRKNMPEGMKAIGGIGNGVFEIAQDLAGFENLCILSYEEPEVFAGLFEKIGLIMGEIWEWFLNKHGDTYCVCRFGDDLGYKSNTMLSSNDIIKNIIPQYKKIISLIHSYNKPFLLHSCGSIFSVMDELINEAGIDCKHSNEDQIAQMKVWVDNYGAKIGNFGGIDTDNLVRLENTELKNKVTQIFKLAASKNGGFAIGSGNSIPSYVDKDKYLIMINTVRELRGDFE